MMAWNKGMYQSKAINVALQLASERLPELADVPTILDVARNDDERAALKLIIARQTMARPYVAPPGIPPERLKALRAAFDATLADPEFLADAQRQDLEVRPVSAVKADALISEIYASPAAVVKLAIDVMKETN
jgi:tripartite-type tricarboxylate transporter receptor subunit TctC